MGSRTRTSRAGGDQTGTNESLAEAYLHWLIEQVQEGNGHHSRTYWDVLRLMHSTEFVWLVPNDDNRIVDGTDLRKDYLTDQGMPRTLDTDQFGPCSVLEVMIGLSRRMAFQAGDSAEGWAWQLLCNLGLDKFKDPLSRRKGQQAADILNNLIWRNYDPDGSGGFFPLAWPDRDQTKVEIWYQMSQYAMEIHPEY